MENSKTLFLSILPPPKVKEALSRLLIRFQKNLATTTTEDKWHLTVLFLGECNLTSDNVAALTKPLELPFLLTITLSHLGRGLKPNQLWAYAPNTYPLKTTRELLSSRIQGCQIELPITEPETSFTPHIRLATIKSEMAETMLPDEIISMTFVPEEIVLLSSEKTDTGPIYSTVGSIQLHT